MFSIKLPKLTVPNIPPVSITPTPVLTADSTGQCKPVVIRCGMLAPEELAQILASGDCGPEPHPLPPGYLAGPDPRPGPTVYSDATGQNDQTVIVIGLHHADPIA